MITTENQPSIQFIQSVSSGVAYWYQRTHQADDWTIGDLDAERQNLLRAVQFGLKLSQTWQDTAEVALQSFQLVERRGYWAEWIPILEQAIEKCTEEELALKFKLLNRLGQLYHWNRALTEAIHAHEQAEVIAKKLNDEYSLAEARHNLSEDHFRSRRYSLAEEYGLAALNSFTNTGANEAKLAATLNTLGVIAYWRGDLTLSARNLSQAIVFWNQLNQPVSLARSLANLANTLQADNKFDEALQCLTEAGALLESTANQLDQVMIQVNLGYLYFNLNRWAEAEAAFRQANSAYLRQSGYTYYRAVIANNLGNVLLRQKRLTAAEAYLRQAIALWLQTDDNLMLANTLGTLAETLTEQGQIVGAVPFYNEAIALLAHFPDDARANQWLAKFIAQRKTLEHMLKA